MSEKKEIRQAFYDIESLNNVFTLCNYRYNDNEIDVYFLVDDELDTHTAVNQPYFTSNVPSTGRFTLTKEIQDYIIRAIFNANSNLVYTNNHTVCVDGTEEQVNVKIKDRMPICAINFFDLHDYNANLHFINTFGAKDDTGLFEKLAAKEPCFSMFINDTDACYSDTENAYLLGYNSQNYDMTMIALYISEAFWVKDSVLEFAPPTARTMRDFNNDLFTPKYKERMPSYLQRDKNKNSDKSGFFNRENVIRNNMMRSGRYIDVALLNEKMQKVGLKRVLGMLGYQILESKKLKGDQAVIYTVEELADLIAYNVSDVVNLHALFMHPVYQGNFELKKGLLETYPELVYNQAKDKYSPDIRPDNVRKDRLYIDSSSAKLAARTLCPYGNLNDIEAVSFMYPSEAKSKELGIPRVNVLDECRKFFYGLYPNRPDLQAEFDRIYFYYKNNIEGRNFNDSNEYVNFWGKNGTPKPAYSMNEIPKENLTLTYYNRDGSPSSCYVSFGTGGIHGAEYNKALFENDLREYEALEKLHMTVRTQYPDPVMLKQKNPATKKAWSFEYDGTTYKASEFLKTGSTKDKAEWKDISKKKPMLFKPKVKGGHELNKRYTYTSNNDSSHEDFKSYYPNLLCMMQAFMNEGLGYDRYYEIFENKEKYGEMKAAAKSEEEKYHFDLLRNGTKLILNSASGAADCSYFTPIRMNNQIMSMRIIGQLFTWRIGQAQTYEGASIISTNTDGLFSVFEPVKNAEILAREAANINVAIEPEFCHLVSKDSNNRIEIDEKGEIITASGGSLACYKRPNPTKSLAHAAIIDWALCEYLRNVDNIHGNISDFMAELFDLDKGRVILFNSKFAFPDTARYLNMFQTIIASSVGSQNYIFGETDNFQGYKHYMNEIPFNQGLFNAACESGDINIMSHYNRIFFVKPEFGTKYNKPVYLLRNASARVVTPAQKLTRQRTNQILIQHDPYAKAVLEKFGLLEKDIPDGKEAKITKVSGIGAEWHVYIENRNLFLLDEEERQLLIDNLDTETYLTLLADSFNKNWSNNKFASKEDEDENAETGS